jgi:hypothetical protein
LENKVCLRSAFESGGIPDLHSEDTPFDELSEVIMQAIRSATGRESLEALRYLSRCDVHEYRTKFLVCHFHHLGKLSQEHAAITENKIYVVFKVELV